MVKCIPVVEDNTVDLVVDTMDLQIRGQKAFENQHLVAVENLDLEGIVVAVDSLVEAVPIDLVEDMVDIQFHKDCLDHLLGLEMNKIYNKLFFKFQLIRKLPQLGNSHNKT